VRLGADKSEEEKIMNLKVQQPKLPKMKQGENENESESERERIRTASVGVPKGEERVRAAKV
jgi:hypothetical protein